MSEQKSKPARGRPRLITREKIADAGIALGLEELTFVGVAASIGVSQMALYKHVDGLDELRSLVAEEAFLRWPLPSFETGHTLGDYLERFSTSLWQLVYEHAGIAPYLLRQDKITPAMTERIQTHQQEVAAQFGLTFEQCNQLIFSIAFHCCAVADASRAETPLDDGMKTLHRFGLEALIAGALVRLDLVDRG